jgi:hypothetical protein
MRDFFLSPEKSLVAFVAISLVQAVLFMVAPEVRPRHSNSLKCFGYLKSLLSDVGFSRGRP